MTATSAPDLTSRNQLLALAQRPDPYPFLSLVDDYLHREPLDDQVRATAVSLLLKKGLHTVAAEVAAGCPDASPEAAALHNAARALSGLPSERIPEAVARASWEGNLAAFATRGEPGRQLAAALQDAWANGCDGFTLHRTSDGNLLTRGIRSDGCRIWLPAALDYANRVESIPEAAGWKGCMLAPFIFDGVGAGWAIARTFDGTEEIFVNHRPAIHVIETNLRALATVLRLHDWRRLITSNRFFLCAGPDAWADWKALMRSEPRLPVTPEVTSLHRWPGQVPSEAQAALDEIQAWKESLIERERRRAEAVYAGRDAAYWAKRFASIGPDRPLRVLGVTSRFTTFLQHSMRDLLAAFERAGAQTRLLIEEADHFSIPRHHFLATQADFEPDLIVVIDHHRFEYERQFLPNVPYVCWIQDELVQLFLPETGARLGPLDYTIGFGREQCVLQHGYPAGQFMPCKLAISPAKLRAEADEAIDDALRCDIVYVSHQSEPPEALHDRIRASIDHAPMLQLLDTFFEQARELMTSSRFNAAFDLYRLLDEAVATANLRCGDEPRERLMTLYVRPLADRFIRHTTLAWAADWVEATGRTMHLYGRGWEKHPRFGRYARGTAEHGSHLGQIARAAGINLHMGINPALHQRVLETVAAGGFVMARYYPFDFYEPANRTLLEFIRRAGITEPTRLPADALPPEYNEARARTARVTNRPVEPEVEITPELLLMAAAPEAIEARDAYASLAFPRFAEITFADPVEFATRAERFLSDRAAREEIVQGMRTAVEELFTYDALVRRIVPFLAKGLAETARKDA